jgi:hypothetical protein
MLFGGQSPFLNPNKNYGNQEQAFNEILQSPLNIPKHPEHLHVLVELVSHMLEKEPECAHQLGKTVPASPHQHH